MPLPKKPARILIDATCFERTATYTYHDEEGRVLSYVDRCDRKVLYQDAGGVWESEKTYRPRPAAIAFRQRADGEPIGASMDGVRLVLYNLPDVLSAIGNGGRVWIVEGERCADWLNLWLRDELGSNDRATTSPGGAKRWRAEYAQYLIGADVMIWPDDDEPGREYADTVARSLAGVAQRVRIVPPEEARAIVQEVSHEG